MILSERRVASCERIDEKDTWQQLTIYLLIVHSCRPFDPLGRSGDPLSPANTSSSFDHRSIVPPTSSFSPFYPTGVIASPANCEAEPRRWHVSFTNSPRLPTPWTLGEGSNQPRQSV